MSARARAAAAQAAEPAEPGSLLALAERALEQALAAGADEAEVFAVRARSVSVDVERSMVEGAATGGDAGLGIRVLRRRRAGFGYAAEPRRAAEAAEGALRAAGQAPAEGLRFAEPRPAPAAPGPDPRLEAIGVEEAAARAQQVLDAARAVSPLAEVTGGGVGVSSETWALANSRGLRHEESSTSLGAGATVVVKGAALSTGSRSLSSRRDDIDLAAVGREAARLALAGRRPKPVEAGDYTLLLKPEAMQELLEFCCLRGLVAENLRRGESPFVGKVGKAVAARSFSLFHDGALPGGLGSAARDDEGVPAGRVPLVERGVLRGLLHDLRSAARQRADPSGCAQRASGGEGERTYAAAPRAAGLNFAVDGPRQPLEELVAETRRGLVVHDVIGAHTANPTTGEFHVNSTLLFRVERGEVVGPARSVMVSGSMLPWLRAVSGLSAEHADLGGYATPAALRLPWMRIEGVTVYP